MVPVSLTAFEVDDDELTASALEDAEPLRCQKPGCTNAVVKPARGRTPKFCAEHKRGPGSSNKSERSGATWSRAKEVESILNEYIGHATVGFVFAAKFDPAFKKDALVVGSKAPSVVHELVELAKDDKNLRRTLELITAPGKYGPLTVAILGLVIPIMQNHGVLPQISIGGFDTKGGEN